MEGTRSFLAWLARLCWIAQKPQKSVVFAWFRPRYDCNSVSRLGFACLVKGLWLRQTNWPYGAQTVLKDCNGADGFIYVYVLGAKALAASFYR